MAIMPEVETRFSVAADQVAGRISRLRQASAAAARREAMEVGEAATNLGHVAEILIWRAAERRRGPGCESFAGNWCVFYSLRA